MKKALFLLCILFAFACKERKEVRVTSQLRAPAYPLINIDTYTNAWLFGDNLYDNQLKHWTGEEFPLIGAIRVDGEVYRFMGVERPISQPLHGICLGEDWAGRYVNEKPDGNWMIKNYNDSDWKEGKAGFGTRRREQMVNTVWKAPEIWVRREFVWDESFLPPGRKLLLEYSHDDEVEIYINGIEVVRINDRCQEGALLELPDDVVASLRKGKNIIAAHCKNVIGDAYLDFGLSLKVENKSYFQKTAVQKSVEVLPTQTIYNFTCGPVDLELIFTAPLLMDNLELLSRPVNYITYTVSANDSKFHDVKLYLEAGTSWALDLPREASESDTFEKDGLLYLKTGSKAQEVLGRKGDDVRINWGYFYLSAEKENTQSAVGDARAMRDGFCNDGSFDKEIPASPDEHNNLAFVRSLGEVKKAHTGYFMLGYDDVYSMQYFGENLPPYWNKNEDKTIFDIFFTAKKEYKLLRKACFDFDNALMKKATECGGKEYAELCALAYRQAISAHKLLQAPNGDLLFLSKENSSGGAVSTVDVTYPSAPLFLLYNVDLLKGMLNPIFYYVESGKWGRPFAPHDVGIYPIANGQTSGTYLPVEESGNMLILTAAIATIEGNASYAQKHWNALSQWADFLVNHGFDPDSQENTDVFTGYSAHNANLSIKAIQGIASYGRLADMLGENDIAQKYTVLARNMALDWVIKTDDGDHYRFAFDQPGTWSQKYNLVWDKFLKINAFPHEVLEKEIAYYLTKQNKYGLPLDYRYPYTKADWIIWSATLACNTYDFQQLILPLYRFTNETTDRIPMSDWYWTDKPEYVAFYARSVLGGYFIKMLEDKLIVQPN